MWQTGISWTKGYMAETTNPDGTISKINVHGGLFVWLPIQLNEKYRLEMYIGFRPTPTWGVGYGNEGDGKIFTKIGQWMKQHGWGNFGVACRVKHAI